MPMRASRQQIGTTLGRVLFRGKATTQGIQKKLTGIGQTKLQESMARRGLSGVTKKEIGDVFAGKHRSGWSASDLKKAVEVLQDVGIASKKETASSMVMRVSQSTAGQGGVNLKEVLTDSQYKQHMKELARARRTEAEGGKTTGSGVLDRMRGPMGQVNKPAETGGPEEIPAGTNIRETRDALRTRIKLSPKLILPEPGEKSDSKRNGGSSSAFQV